MENDILVPGDENELSASIRLAIGAGTYERIKVLLPQFERTNGQRVFYFPKTVEEFDKIKTLPDDLLEDFCLGIWNDNNGIKHWLYPGEWYDFIPDGYEIVDIYDNIEKFKKGETDDDIRYGCLSYGFKIKDNSLTGKAVTV